MTEKKISLKEQLEFTSKGCYHDPSVLLPKLEEAASWPLCNLFDESDLASLKDSYNCLEIGEPFEIYQDVVNLIIKLWKLSKTDNENIYSEYIQNFILKLVGVYNNELTRRLDADGYTYVKKASDFPGFSIPLPRLLQAGAIRCKNRKFSETLSNLYQNKLMNLLKKIEVSENTVSDCLIYQPSSRFFYDPVTMTYAIGIAEDRGVLSTEEFYEFYFDILILPYLVD